MRTSKSYKLILISIFLFIMVDAAAQRTSRSSRTRTGRTTERTRQVEEKDPDQGSWLGLSIGNLGFNRGFMASGKVSYGYDINKYLGFGANGKFFFDNFNQIGPDINLFSYGAAAFARIYVTQEIYLQGEYGRTNFERAFTNGTTARESYTYPSVGGGYKSGFGNWSYGLHILVPLSETPRDILNLEYWIDFNYKF